MMAHDCNRYHIWQVSASRPRERPSFVNSRCFHIWQVSASRPRERQSFVNSRCFALPYLAGERLAAAREAELRQLKMLRYLGALITLVCGLLSQARVHSNST